MSIIYRSDLPDNRICICILHFRVMQWKTLEGLENCPKPQTPKTLPAETTINTNLSANHVDSSSSYIPPYPCRICVIDRDSSS